MINFFLLAWNTSNPKQKEIAMQLIQKAEENKNDFRKVFQVNGLIVYAQSKTSRNSFVLSNNSGIILGRLFKKTDSWHGDASVNEISIAESKKIIDSHGNYLSNKYWGSYVSILPIHGKKLVIGRDCSGLQLCYTTWKSEVFIAFSNFDSLPFLDSIKKEIDWSYLTTSGVYGVNPLIQTGLKNIVQLPAGQYADVDLQTQKVDAYRSWKPEEFTNNLIEDQEIAQEMLYNTVLSVVTAQSNDFENIALMLSGGLDSSILLSCLRKTHPAKTIHAKHYHSLDNDVSEAHFAQSMADAYNVEMEIEHTKAGTHSSYIGHITPPWPIPVDRDRPEDNDDNIEANYRYQQYIRSNKIEGIFKGQGGDQIFFKRPQLAPLFDYKRRHVFDARYYRILLNTARLTEMSIWKLLKINGKKPEGLVENTNMRNVFLTKSALDSSEPFDHYNSHPWFQGNHELSYGKYNQLKQFTFFNHYAQTYTPSAPDLPQIIPFICQPLMEVMLRTPTDFLLAEGRNRGLARLAFKNELTPEVYNRERKGYVTKYFFNGLIANLNSIKEFLHDGLLVREQFLDKVALDTHLNEDNIKLKIIGSHILNCLKYEKWARSVS